MLGLRVKIPNDSIFQTMSYITREQQVAKLKMGEHWQIRHEIHSSIDIQLFTMAEVKRLETAETPEAFENQKLENYKIK